MLTADMGASFFYMAGLFHCRTWHIVSTHQSVKILQDTYMLYRYGSFIPSHAGLLTVGHATLYPLISKHFKGFCFLQLF